MTKEREDQSGDTRAFTKATVPDALRMLATYLEQDNEHRVPGLDDVSRELARRLGAWLTEQTAGEAVNHPAHYTANPSGVECIDVFEWLPANLATGVKHCWRKDNKELTPMRDLQKARWYFDREMARVARIMNGKGITSDELSFLLGRVFGTNRGLLAKLAGELIPAMRSLRGYVESGDYGALTHYHESLTTMRNAVATALINEVKEGPA